MSDNEAITLRLPPELLAELRMVARIDGTSMGDAARSAVRAWITLRRGDAEFQARLRTRLAHDKRMLERLALGPIGGEET